MAEAKKPSPAKPIKDVAPPGESAPSPNSKSVIVSNRPLLKDPMVVDKTAASKSDPSDDSLAAVSNKSGANLTAPLLETEESDHPAASTKAAKPPTPSKSLTEPGEETPAEPEKPAEKEKPAEEPADKAAAPSDKDKQVDAVAAVAAEAAKEAQRQGAVEKLAENKKYYLPINSVERRKARHFVILGLLLSLLLVLAWADIALDAGLINVNGIKPPTHFFSN